MTVALERALNSLSGVERRSVIRAASDLEGIGVALARILIGIRAELLSDVARELEMLSALDAEMAADRQALDDRPYPAATGPTLWFDPATGTASTEPPTRT